MASALAAGAGLRAQETLVPPAPLAREVAKAPASEEVLPLNAAQRAHDLGLPSIAAEMYREQLDTPGAETAGLGLRLATTLLDAGRADEAEKVLAGLPEPHGAPWQLRSGLAALQLRNRDRAQAAWDAIKADEVPEVDRAWYWFLTGALYDTAAVRDVKKANDYYVMAERAAATELASARFQLAAEKVRLELVEKPSEVGLKQTFDIYERNQGRSVGYDAAKIHAVMLSESGRRGEAVTFLQRVLVTVPEQERDMADELRFVLGMIGDRGRNGAGRHALSQLLESGKNVVRQRQALQLLAAASTAEPMRSQFRAELGKYIGAKPAHPILESLLLYRAQLALSEDDYVRAEDDANGLIKQFPQSSLRVHALGVLTQSAWAQRRFRLAADYARRARDELAASSRAGTEAGGAASAGAGQTQPVSTAAAPAIVAPRARVDFAVLEAEARFRAGDYRNAADAYAAVVRERPAELEPRRLSELMFQWVYSETKAGSTDAAKVLDTLASDPAFDLESRWRAEWHLARALQLQGDAGVKQAYARVNSLLAEPAANPAALKADLRARMAWLRARLSFESGEPARTLELVEALLGTRFEVNESLKAEIASVTTLLKARAEFALGREPAALETLRTLRADYPKTDAAISSFILESEYFAAQDKIDEARNRLISLTDNPAYKNSEFVPLALFRLALLSERLGREENLKEANKRIEEMIERVAQNPSAGQGDLIFAARLRQGHILRKLNEFPAAQRAYEFLVNQYSQHGDVVLAQLALAECHNAQSAADPSHAEHAQLLFEQLRDRVDAPPDVRVEAGYNLGALLARRGKLEEAAKVWWEDVINPFLRDGKTPIEENAKRPYWLARTLRDLGDLLEKQGRIEEAKTAYLLLLEKRLPNSETVARSRLEQLGVTVPRSGQ